MIQKPAAGRAGHEDVMFWTIAGVLLISALIANQKHHAAERQKARMLEERIQKAAVDRSNGLFPMPGTEDAAFEAVLAARGVPNRPTWAERNPKGMWHQGTALRHLDPEKNRCLDMVNGVIVAVDKDTGEIFR